MLCHPEAFFWPKDLAFAFAFVLAVVSVTAGKEQHQNQPQPRGPSANSTLQDDNVFSF